MNLPCANLQQQTAGGLCQAEPGCAASYLDLHAHMLSYVAYRLPLLISYTDHCKPHGTVLTMLSSACNRRLHLPQGSRGPTATQQAQQQPQTAQQASPDHPADKLGPSTTSCGQ